MGLTGTHKTCLPVAGKPVIIRSIEACRAAGISLHVVVVGIGAEYVLKTVGSAFPDVLFAYQPEPLGTGNAAKCGARVVSSIGYDGDVLLVAGDKLIAPELTAKMLRRFRSSQSDCLFLIGRREDSPGSGRVILDEEGRPVRVIEAADIQKARALSRIAEQARSGAISPDFVAQAIAATGMRADKARVAFGILNDFAAGTIPMSKHDLLKEIKEDDVSFRVPMGRGAKKISADEADSAEYVNLSVYVVGVETLTFALKKIEADNAQREEYLTDMIDILSMARTHRRKRFKIAAMGVDHPQQVMGFNSLEELRAIEEYLRETRS